MADGLNRATLLGNLGADPDLRYTASGAPVLNLRLATTESWWDKEGQKEQERTDWHYVVVWGKLGEALSKFLKKGDLVYIEGPLRTESYEHDGVTKYSTKVHAQFVRACGGRPPATGGTAQGRPDREVREARERATGQPGR
jgi:single-strand DNA-binding protein